MLKSWCGEIATVVCCSTQLNTWWEQQHQHCANMSNIPITPFTQLNEEDESNVEKLMLILRGLPVYEQQRADINVRGERQMIGLQLCSSSIQLISPISLSACCYSVACI